MAVMQLDFPITFFFDHLGAISKNSRNKFNKKKNYIKHMNEKADISLYIDVPLSRLFEGGA